MPERRKADRKHVRIRVRFWRPGEPDKVFVGYTTEISATGCFIQTDQPIRTSGRLQMELTGEPHGFVCEGVVARSIKAPVELRSVKPSGMGVRFRTIPELLLALVPGVLTSEEAASVALEHGGNSQDDATGNADPASGQRRDTDQGAGKVLLEHGESKVQQQGEQKRPADFESHSEAAKRAARSHPAAAQRGEPNKQEIGSDAQHSTWHPTGPTGKTHPGDEPVAGFRLAPSTLEQLDYLYRTELLNRRVFVPTSKAYSVGSLIRVQLCLPGSERTIEFLGSVTKRRLRSTSSDGTPIRGGLELKLNDIASQLKATGSFLSEKLPTSS